MITFKYSTSKDHYSKYKGKETDDLNILFTDMATRCISPVTTFKDKEMLNVKTGDTWISKNHRSNENIQERGNIALIDYEGSQDNFKKLLKCMDDKNLWYLAVPSQSNKSRKETRYHIAYLLEFPYSVNSQSMKKQAKEFFNFISYRWDEPDSGIDTRATFTASGYFSPSIPLKEDAKSKGNKKITEPYIDLDDVFKDTIKSSDTAKAYTPIASENDDTDDEFSNTQVRGKRVKEINTKIIRNTSKGYVLSPDTHIMTGRENKFITFEKLVEKLDDMEGENPRISMLGCPICNPGHTETKPGYAYMQYDNNGTPYIHCTGNACEEKPFFTMAEGNVSVYKMDEAAGVTKYVMFKDERLIYTHNRDMTYKRSGDSVADALFNLGLGVNDEHGNYSRNNTISKYCVGSESIEIHNNPFIEEGLDLKNKIYNISPSALFAPKEEEPNDIIKEAIKAFEDDVIINGYPISLIYIAYYMFHHKQIMAVLFLVNSDRGSGKSFWVLDLPTWFLGYSKVSGMGSAAIIASWDDEKDGRRLVVYEDIENLSKRELGILRGEIKSDATSGSSKFLNIKGQGKKRSFGFNSAGTTNYKSQIPFDGEGDRRIYPCPYKKIDKSKWLSNKLRLGTKEAKINRTNAVNYLYKIYQDCEYNMTPELNEALYYKVPQSKIKHDVEDSTSNDSYVAISKIKRARSVRIAVKELVHVVHTGIDKDDLKELVEEIEFTDEEIRIHASTLKHLWEMLPSGKNNNMKSYNNRQIIKIFGIEESLKNSLRVKGIVKAGVVIKR